MGNTKYNLILTVITMFITFNSFAQFAQSDHFNIIENNSTVLDVRINDGYEAGIYLTIPYQNDSGITFFPPQHGSIIFLNNYTIFYTPDSGFTGHDEFVYGIAVADKIYYAIDTARVYIEVIAPNSALCQANIAYNINSVTNQVSFQGTNLYPISGNPTTYLWIFSDSTTSTTANPIHYFPNGTGQACLTINTAFGCSSTICDSIIITGNNCEAGFTYLQENCNNCFSFSDISLGTVQSWSWDFGDNTESEQQNPDHVFPDSGFYQVCLSVITNQNCQDSYCENIYVPYHHIDSSSCNSSFTYFHSALPECINCYDFSDFSVGNIISWNWQFGDGEISTLQVPSHTFLIPGIYNVCLKIITEDSCSSQYCREIEATEQNICSADFSFVNTDNNVISFTDISEASIVNRHWDFGDGTASDLQNPQHIFPATGHYQVCLTITTTNGCTNTICKDVQIISQIVENIIFGGYVYAGNQLLPEGIVIIYDIEKNYKAVARGYIINGLWGFVADSVGKYLVYAIPKYDYNSFLNKMYLPTYFGDKLYWQSADTVNTSTSSYFEIQLEVANDIMPYYGDGSIQGGISYTNDSTYESLIYDADWFGYDSINNNSHLLSNNARNMPVLLLNENNQPVKFQLSGIDGLFTFSNMANNIYKIHTEKAGLLTLPISLTLNTQNPDITDISIVIGSTEISSGISNLNQEELFNNMTLYPVPVKDALHVKIETELNEKVQIEITDALGRIINSLSYKLNKGSNYIDLNTEQYNHGLYFVKFSTEKGRIYTTKFTK